VEVEVVTRHLREARSFRATVSVLVPAAGRKTFTGPCASPLRPG
jgi:hypothetical protein